MRTRDSEGNRRWIIPLGRARRVPAGAHIHRSVFDRMSGDPGYRPVNLPDEYREEVWRVYRSEIGPETIAAPPEAFIRDRRM